MNTLVTLAAPTGPQDPGAADIPVRPIEARDLPELTEMYRHAYTGGPPPPHGGTVGRIRALLEGTHGTPVAEACLVSAGPDGQLTAAIIITDTTLGNEVSAAAFIAELFTHPAHRRQGLAEELLRRCMHALHSMGRRIVAVSVDSSNAPAMALYLSRDFRRLPDDDSDSDSDSD